MEYPEQQSRTRISLGQSNNALVTLVAICLVTFVGLAFMKAVWYFRYPKELALGFYYRDILSWFVMPADGHAFLSRPWTIITHFFVHDNFWQVLSNMLWLWCFGYILQDMTGNRKLAPVFIYGALAGALAFMLALHTIPHLRAALPVAVVSGASAGVMALAIVTTLISPNYKLFPLIGGGLPLWALTLLYVVSDLLTVSISDTAILIHHLAGAAAGFLFVFLLRRGYDTSDWMSRFFDWVNNLFHPGKPSGNKPVKEQLFYKSANPPYTRTPNVTQERVDAILDKINQQGYHFLTDEEKEILKRAAEEEE